MAITKNPLIRYKILDSCFRNPYKKYTIDNLLVKVNEELFQISDSESQCIKLRQLRDDIAFMRSSEGWSIELAEEFENKKRIYRYEDLNFSINNAPLNDLEMHEFQTAIQALSQFEGMPQFEGIQEIVAKLKYDLHSSKERTPFIGFDSQQDLKGIEHFSFLYQAVQNKTPLAITYKDFINKDAYSFVLHPYYLKQYNHRWFLFGLHQESGKCDWNVAIDRIISVEESTTLFFPNTSIDWRDYFSDMIGVSRPVDGIIEEVVLHFNSLTGKYMENKSLHETQRHKWIDENTLELKIKVFLNYELERLILSYGESVRVIAPEVLREKIVLRLNHGIGLYI
ncbi:helix-turn-helix transcriptional regulator [Flavobacterium sp. RSSA_27]|uniref:helix-turn-helix transcriptional regulator n=1 Tax=Flavobacterium sp. RSSA_27 TaxID=3447667 RepID=UPI003F2AFAE1